MKSRSCKIGSLNYCITFKIWQAHRQHCCQCTCPISQWYEHFNTWSCVFETLRSHDKTSYWILKWGPVVICFVKLVNQQKIRFFSSIHTTNTFSLAVWISKDWNSSGLLTSLGMSGGPYPVFFILIWKSCNKTVIEYQEIRGSYSPYLTWQMSPTSISLTGSCITSPLRITANLCSHSILFCSPRNCFSFRQSLKAVTKTTTMTAARIATPSIQPASCSVSSPPETTRKQGQGQQINIQMKDAVSLISTIQIRWT